MSDLIWDVLPPSVLVQAAQSLEFPAFLYSANDKGVLTKNLPSDEQEEWADKNRSQISGEFCRVGSWSYASNRTYTQVLQGTARKVMAAHPSSSDNVQLETEIVAKVWNQAITKMTPAQRALVQAQLESLAAKHGKSIGKEFTGLAVLTAAQLSGFGVYLAGSTLLGALNGVLGLGLGFGAFAGLSSLISTVIGPLGWAALGVVSIAKLGSPSYKRILPVIWLIAATRPIIPEKAWKVAQKHEDDRADQIRQMILQMVTNATEAQMDKARAVLNSKQ